MNSEESLNAVPEDMLNCTVCHGVMFQGNHSTKAPNLTGLAQWYIEGQLKAFKQGMRGTHHLDYSGAEMYAFARSLDEESIKTYSRYIASLPVANTHEVTPALSGGVIKGDPVKGKSLYEPCAACHGMQAEGNKSVNAPALNTQGFWYLKKQLMNFKQGYRGYKKDDTQGKLMASLAQQLASEDDINNVLAYIATLGRSN